MEQSASSSSRAAGAVFEEMALGYLIEQGYHLFKRNFRFGRVGEIDLVMKDGAIWVFVEVKGRQSHQFGLPEEAVTPAKRRQVRKVAECFVQIMKLTDYVARFDVVAIDYVTGTGGKPEIRHWIDAF